MSLYHHKIKHIYVNPLCVHKHNYNTKKNKTRQSTTQKNLSQGLTAVTVSFLLLLAALSRLWV